MAREDAFDAGEEAMSAKELLNVAEKQAIARYAAKQIQPDDVVFLDAGSPNQVVRYARQGVRCFSTEAASLLQVKARLLEEDLTAPAAD